MTSSDTNLEEQVTALFESLVPAQGSVEGSRDAPVHSIKLASLPDVLVGFEKKTGVKLLQDDLLPQVEAFVQSNPYLDVQPEMVVAVIRQLQDANWPAVAEAGDAIQSPPRAQDAAVPKAVNEDANAKSGESSDFDSSTSATESEEDEHGGAGSDADEPIDPTTRKSAFAFPRSKSERADLSVDALTRSRCSANLSPRMPTTSDPSTPNAKHRRRSLGNRERTDSTSEREVLKGKGKVRAPPSAWSRPKPQAIANRARYSSDASAGSSYEGAEYDRSSLTSDSPRSAVIGLGKAPSDSGEKRPRMSSYPTFSSLETALADFPGSPSFSFPRAQSPGEDDMRDAEAHERWRLLSEDLQGRGISSGPTSPMHDEHGLYTSTSQQHGTSAKARSSGSRRSSGAGRRCISGEPAVEGETRASLQAQVEGLRRLLSEKKHTFEQMQHETEDYISRLQEELDRIKGDMALKRKEEIANRVRENNHLDLIASLEADLNKANSELTTIKAQYARLRSDHDELVDAMERHTSRNIELRDELNRSNQSHAEHVENEKMWDEDRESYRDTIKNLHEEVAGLQQKLLGRDEDARVISSLQANIDALSAELEELRNRGSTISGRRDASDSANTTLSKRLGAELARSNPAAHSLMHEAEEDDAGKEGKSHVDGDTSSESVFVIHRRKRPHQRGAPDGKPLELVDADTQTEPANGTIAPTSVARDQGAPPTYDEASLEKDIVQRLHPTYSSGSQETVLVPTDDAYLTVAQKVGVRCVHLEERLRKLIVLPGEEEHSRTRQLLPLSRILTVLSRILMDPAASARTLQRLEWRKLLASSTSDGPQSTSHALLLHSFIVFIVGLALGAIFFRGDRGRSGGEDTVAWHLSNTLEVPWSHAAGNAGQAGTFPWLAWLVAGPTSAWQAYRVPT